MLLVPTDVNYGSSLLRKFSLFIGVVKGVFKKRDDGLCTADDVAKNWPTWHANCIKIRHVILTVFDVIPTGFHVILVPYDDVINWPTTS